MSDLSARLGELFAAERTVRRIHADLTKRGALTKLVRKKWSVNQEMSDELFSKRSLEK